MTDTGTDTGTGNNTGTDNNTGRVRLTRTRLWGLVLAVVLLAGGATAYTLRAADRAPRPVVPHGGPALTLEGPAGGLLFRDTATGRVGRHDPGSTGPRAVGGPHCDRFHAAGPTALCLRRRPGVPTRSYAIVLDRRLREVRRIALPGIPNRARVSASGQLLSWTMFATGDSYATSAFSTRTSILDLRTGYLVKNMEQMPLTLHGRRYHAPDVNYWGVTFARDDNRFYATVATKGRTYLVEGDMRRWSANALRENVECPSLSPDNTRIAFKKKVSDDPKAPWRLYVLDLRTLREHPVAEERSIDDQAAWTDDRTLAYGHQGAVWTVPADGTGAPRRSVPGATSPAVLR
ncbi:TolB family protein [Streptomyces sp. NPDC015346]|uniref:TolB family protein n=1 Tax=Streptomyces sp. NPDC015346 TaxID=3364954 RepID=UPI0036FE5A67